MASCSGITNARGADGPGDFIVAEIPGSPRGGDAPEQPRIFRVADARNAKGQPWGFPMAASNLTDTTLEYWQSVDEELGDVPDEGGPMQVLRPRHESNATLVCVRRPTQLRVRSIQLPPRQRILLLEMPKPRGLLRVAATPRRMSKSGSGTTPMQRRCAPR